jgi:hypothetical protein
MKKCSFEGCKNNQFGGGFCLRHQHKRTDKLKQGQNKLYNQRSVKSNTKVPPKQKSGFKHELQCSFGFVNQQQMFDFVWSTRPHVCMFTGLDLDLVPKYQYTWMFMHILRKGKYPLWKYNPDNIVLGHPNFHLAADNFTEEERIKHPNWNFNLWFDLVEQKKEEYKKFLLDNML